MFFIMSRPAILPYRERKMNLRTVGHFLIFHF